MIALVKILCGSSSPFGKNDLGMTRPMDQLVFFDATEKPKQLET